MIKIKQEFEGLVITRNTLLTGQITLDTNTVEERFYQNFINIGFGDIFEDIEEQSVEQYLESVNTIPVVESEIKKVTNTNGKKQYKSKK